MDWLLPFRPRSDGQSSDPGLPRWLLRQMVCLGRISIGSRVLVAGCGTGELTRYLHELTIDASGLDESPDLIARARSSAPHLAYACSQASVAVPFSEHSFHTVVFRNVSEHRGDLLGPGALRATAHLAATVLPGGNLVLIARLAPEWSNHPDGHLETCYRHHLECFPGVCQVSYQPDSLVSRSTWSWMLGRQPRSGYVIAALNVPSIRRSRSEWEQIAEQAASRQQPCCAWGGEAIHSMRAAI